MCAETGSFVEQKLNADQLQVKVELKQGRYPENSDEWEAAREVLEALDYLRHADQQDVPSQLLATSTYVLRAYIDFFLDP